MISQALLIGLMQFINSTEVLPPVTPSEFQQNMPQIIEATEGNEVLAVYRCYALLGNDLSVGAQELQEIADFNVAQYCFNRITFMEQGLDFTSPVIQGYLLHELVHWVQDYHYGIYSRCSGINEAEAYAVEREWRNHHNVGDFSEHEWSVIRAHIDSCEGE